MNASGNGHGPGFLSGLFSMFGSKMAIDLGTKNTVVYMCGKGIVVNEPSIVAVNKETGNVEAVGTDAVLMHGRVPGNLVTIKPLKDGVIADFDVTEKMLAYFIKKAKGGNFRSKPRVIVGVPSEITQVERRAVKESVTQAHTSEVHIIDQVMAAAVGAGLPIGESSGSMIVEVGGGTTDIAVISQWGIIYSKAIRVAGNEMDEAIIRHMKTKYNLLIGERTAEQIKMQIGSAYPLDERQTMEVKGRYLIEGLPKTFVVTDEEIRIALNESIKVIVDAVLSALGHVNIGGEIASDIRDRGIVLSGGGALLRNLDRRMKYETGLSVDVAVDPLMSVACGAGKMWNDPNLLRKAEEDSNARARSRLVAAW